MSTSVPPFDGINEKLKRADENILNLNREIIAFFNDCEDPIRGDEDLQASIKKCLQQGQREIPIRISVLTGEIIHHFRSSLDHLAWLLALPIVREKHPTKIEFPIFLDEFNKDGSPSIDGKIKLFATAGSQRIIREIQPYTGSDPARDILWIIHDLDRKAKHRELPLMVTGYTFGSARLNDWANSYPSGDRHVPEWVAEQLNQGAKLSPQVSFREFVKGESQPLIPALSQLRNEVGRIIRLFESEL